MAISYPISLPSSPAFRTCRITPRHVAGMSESPFSLEQQVYDWNAGRWEAEMSWPPMTRAQAAPIIAALVSLKGRAGTFLLGDPDFTSPAGVATGTPLVNGAHTARATSLATKGWTAGVTGILKAGDRIQLGSGATARMHMVLSDANSDGSGNAVLDVWPPLRSDYSDGAAIVTSNVKSVFRLVAPATWESDEVPLFGISLSAVEAL